MCHETSKFLRVSLCQKIFGETCIVTKLCQHLLIHPKEDSCVRRRRTHTNQVVCKSHVSDDIPFQTLDLFGRHLGVDDKCLDMMLPSAGGIVTDLFSAEHELSSALDLRKTSV